MTVSCADIIVMAARDAVFLSNGPRYQVETGRRDGKVSCTIDADNDLPPPGSNIVDLKIYFSVKNLGWKDLVVLSGTQYRKYQRPVVLLVSASKSTHNIHSPASISARFCA
jgi:hypothetical protein